MAISSERGTHLKARDAFIRNPDADVEALATKFDCSKSTVYRGRALASATRSVKRTKTGKSVEHAPVIIELDTSALLGGLQLRLRNGQGLAGTLLVSSDQKVSVRLPNQRDASIGGAVTLPLLGRLLAIGSEL